MTGSDAVLLGQYRGFSMVLAYDGRSNEYRITLKGTLSHTVTLGADVFGNITRLDNALENLAGSLQAEQNSLEETKTQLENARTELAAPFAREEELAEKTARLKELNILLNMDEKDKTPRRGRGCACPEGCGAGTVKEDTMTNEELNTRLYEKMFAEQEQFRDWLLSQPPAEILNHAYEYTVREDILMSLEYNDLEDSQARALLKSGKPLKQIFERWEDKETSHMENIWDTVQEQAKAAEAKQKAKAQKER